MADGGNADTLHDYWAHGEGARQIRWGTHGDHDRCVRLLVAHGHMTTEQAHGYCNLMEKRVTGRYPAQHAAAERVSRMSDYDADGLDGSWDDLDDLPDLAGLDVADFEALDGPVEAGDVSRLAKLGSGARFKALKSKLAAKGAGNPGALAAYIGRKRYGKAKFAALSAKARKGKGGMSRSRAWDEITRPYTVEDLHIMRSGEGDSTGRVIEGYAAVFNDATPITDHQGEYSEIIDPHAFDAALSRMAARRGGLAGAVRVLFNHGKTIEGTPAPEFQKPIGRPVLIEPDARGLRTRTELNRTSLADDVLEMVRSGSITGMSFVGNILRSDPALRGPGDVYRRRSGVLPTVRRMMLGLREYSPVVYAAYPGAEFLGVVRMGLPEDVTATDGGLDEYEEDVPEDVTAATRGEVIPSRSHAHRLWQLNLERQAAEAGIPLRRT